MTWRREAAMRVPPVVLTVGSMLAVIFTEAAGHWGWLAGVAVGFGSAVWLQAFDVVDHERKGDR